MARYCKIEFSPSKNKERKDSEIERILIMISKCLAMNVENGVTMAGSLFTKANWKQLEWFEEDEIQIDIEKAAFVTLKLGIEFGLLKLTENMLAFMVDQKFKLTTDHSTYIHKIITDFVSAKPTYNFMGKIWLDYLCQIDHMWPDVQDMTGKEDTEMTETDSIGRKIGKVTPRKRKSNMNLTQPTEKMVITDDDLSEIDNLSNSTLFERKVAKITSEIEQKMADSLADGDFRSFGRYSGQFFISSDRIGKFKLDNWFNLDQSSNDSDENIKVKESMVEFIFGFLEYLGASSEILQKGLARFIGKNEFSFNTISSAIEVWNSDPISKQLSRTIDLYNISNVVGSQSESEIDIATLKMLEFCNSDNFQETRIRDLIRARFDIKQGQVLTRHKQRIIDFIFNVCSVFESFNSTISILKRVPSFNFENSKNPYKDKMELRIQNLLRKTFQSNEIDLMNLRNCAKFAKRWKLNAVFGSLFQLNILKNLDESTEIYKIIYDEALAADVIQIQMEPQPNIVIKSISKISDAALFFILYLSKIDGIVKISMDPANDEYSIYEHLVLMGLMGTETDSGCKITIGQGGLTESDWSNLQIISM